TILNDARVASGLSDIAGRGDLLKAGRSRLTMHSLTAKRLKKASRIGLLFFGFITAYPIAVGGSLSYDLLWFEVAFIPFMLFLVSYLFFLRLAQVRANRELKTLLGSTNHATPLILFLRSFDTARSGIASRIYSALGAVL